MTLKTVLITGCGSGGIGSALAKELHLRGHRVLATGRSTADIDPYLEPLGIHTFAFDVTLSQSIDDAVATTRNLTGGKLDIIIQNAGLLQAMPIADAAIEDVKRHFDLNVFSVLAVTQAFLPLLRASNGLVVGLGSINADLCPPYLAAYNASKAALEAMLRTMRRELAPLGVRVTILKTGSVRTKLFDSVPETVLPEGSLYAPVQDFIRNKTFLDGARFMDVDDYAKVVAGHITKDTPSPMPWIGGLVWLAWILSWLGWETMMDDAMIKASKLDQLSADTSR